MYTHVLLPVAIDHNPVAGQAMEVAQALAGPQGKITVLNVVELVPAYIDAHVPAELKAQNVELSKETVRDVAGAHENTEPMVLYGHPAQSILDFASNNGVECIVIASHKPGLSDYLIGSTAARVVRHAQCAVHVVR
jgi:nucleotide-binding universal stress UspA family protein